MDIKRDLLANGKVLRAFVSRFEKDRNEQNFLNVLVCLRDSYVWIPYHAEKKQQEKSSKKKIWFFRRKKQETEKSGDDVRLVPDTLTSGGVLVMPVFSSEDQMGDVYKGRAKTVRVHFLEAMAIAMVHKEIEALVLDAFTRPFMLEKDLFPVVKGLPTQMEDEES
ncbi:MAG: SseB family protein [Oscillospiraceae bacterium]|nr:SseB family protein [Oscillospiraceae bacterium]